MPFVSDVPENIAVAEDEFNESGCPFCGYQSGHSYMRSGGAATWRCGDCGRGCFILAIGLGESPIGIGMKGGTTVYPKLQPHPRRGIPKHGAVDKRPENDGEFFRARGLGMDSSPGCFVCGGEKTRWQPKNKYHMQMLDNVAGFAQCKNAGARIVEMFEGKGCWMDYREFEPDRIQVKIGVCKKHVENLKTLVRLTEEHDQTITKEMIKQACE